MKHDYEHLAMNTLETLGENILAPEGITDATIIATALEANTLATLALTEQQARTAAATERHAAAVEARVQIAARTLEKRGHDLPAAVLDYLTA